MGRDRQVFHGTRSGCHAAAAQNQERLPSRWHGDCLSRKSMNFVAHVQYAAMATLLGLTLLAPSASSADPAPVAAHQEQQGLRWPVQGKVISRFGSRRLFHLHRGVDIKAPKGTPIRAAAAGTVAFSGRQSSYGRVIKIDHPNGLRTIYAHNSSNFVRTGQRVKAGAVIAAVGQTGRATANHLHFEVRRRGVARDPLPLLRSQPRVVVQADAPRRRTASRSTRG
jgi:murein DD-endopeptidase MepM/ murein hydrolase activator NlpD